VAPSEKLFKGIRMLKEQGHLVEGRMQFAKLWWEIDCRMLATGGEIEGLADGVYSFSELEELYIKRRADEHSAN
jgi:hypothetical protein